jgi:hypothetical protein
MTERVLLSEIKKEREALGKPFTQEWASRIMESNPDVVDDVFSSQANLGGTQQSNKYGRYGNELWPSLKESMKSNLGSLAYGASLGTAGTPVPGGIFEAPGEWGSQQLGSLAAIIATAMGLEPLLAGAAVAAMPAAMGAVGATSAAIDAAKNPDASTFQRLSAPFVGGAEGFMTGKVLDPMLQLPIVPRTAATGGLFTSLGLAGGQDPLEAVAGGFALPLMLEAGGITELIRRRSAVEPIVSGSGKVPGPDLPVVAGPRTDRMPDLLLEQLIKSQVQAPIDYTVRGQSGRPAVSERDLIGQLFMEPQIARPTGPITAPWDIPMIGGPEPMLALPPSSGRSFPRESGPRIPMDAYGRGKVPLSESAPIESPGNVPNPYVPPTQGYGLEYRIESPEELALYRSLPAQIPSRVGTPPPIYIGPEGPAGPMVPHTPVGITPGKVRDFEYQRYDALPYEAATRQRITPPGGPPADVAPPRAETPPGFELVAKSDPVAAKKAAAERQTRLDALAAEAIARRQAGVTAPVSPPQTVPAPGVRIEPYVAPDTRAIAAEVGPENLRAAGIIPPETTPAKTSQNKRDYSRYETLDDLYAAEVGDVQRNKPEHAMNRVQHEIGGGVMNVAVEHIGDLTHRLADRNTLKWSGGHEFVKEKVTKALGWLRSGYGFMREHEENITSNAKHRGHDRDVFAAKVDKLLKNYADAHREIPVFNRVQQLARDAAIALGEKDVAGSTRNLEVLERMLGEGREAWRDYTRAFDPVRARNSGMSEADISRFLGEPSPAPVAPPETTPAKRTPAQRKAEIAKIAARKKAELEQATIQEPVAPVDPIQAERDAAVAAYLAKQEAPGSPVAGVQPEAAPITPEFAPKRHKRTGRIVGPAAKAEPVALPEYEHMGGIDYLNRKTGDVLMKVKTPGGAEEYLPTSPEYAARARQKAAGIGKDQTMSAPVGKDVTLGTGLGGMQDAKMPRVKFDAPAREVSAGNAVDIGAEKYRKSGAIEDWTRSTAVPKVSDKFIKEIAELKDVKSGEYDIGGRKYALPQLGGGKMGNAIDRDVLWPNLNAELARDDYINTWKMRARSVVDTQNIKSKGSDLFVRAQDPAHAKDADVKAVQAVLKMVRDDYNQAMAATGGNQMGFLENYMPHVEKPRRFDRILERNLNDPSTNEFELMHAKKKTSARAMFRAGKLKPEQLETDVPLLMDKYIESAARVIFNNPVIKQNRLHADALEAAGLKGGAELIRNYTDIIWADKPTALDHRMNNWPQWARVALRSVPAENKKLLNKAVFTMNLAFNLGVQPASVVNTITRYGFANSAKGMFLAMNPEFRRWTWDNTRSGRAKRETHENLVTEGIDRGLNTGQSSKPPTLSDNIERWGEWTTSVVERAVSAHGAASAYYDGKSRGFTGRKLREWMNEGIGKTQEDYYRADLPGNLQNRAAPGWVGFYTYFNGMLNMTRELSGIGKTGHYAEHALGGKSKSEVYARGLRYGIRFLVAAAIYDEYAHALTGRRPHREVATGNLEGVMPGGGGLIPYSHAAGLQRALAQSIRNDTGEPLIKWAVSRYPRAGVFFTRLWETIKAEEDERTVRDIRGNIKYQYEENESWKAWLFGPQSTGKGSEYSQQYMKGDIYKALESEMNDESNDNKPAWGRGGGKGAW